MIGEWAGLVIAAVGLTVWAGIAAYGFNLGKRKGS